MQPPTHLADHPAWWERVFFHRLGAGVIAGIVAIIVAVIMVAKTLEGQRQAFEAQLERQEERAASHGADQHQAP